MKFESTLGTPVTPTTFRLSPGQIEPLRASTTERFTPATGGVAEVDPSLFDRCTPGTPIEFRSDGRIVKGTITRRRRWRGVLKLWIDGLETRPGSAPYPASGDLP